MEVSETDSVPVRRLDAVGLRLAVALASEDRLKVREGLSVVLWEAVGVPLGEGVPKSDAVSDHVLVRVVLGDPVREKDGNEDCV